MLPTLRTSLALLPLLSLALLTSCAGNLSEAQPARVLQEGAFSVNHIHNVIAPAQSVQEAIRAGEAIARAPREGELLPAQERENLIGSAVALGLMSPGYSSHLEFGLGLGEDLDAQVRLGTGVYAASLRRGFAYGRWHGNLGVRGSYSNGSLLPYVDTINSLIKLSELQRYDTQLFVQGGREWGQWARLWMGVKGIHSAYEGFVRSHQSLEDKLDTQVDEKLDGALHLYGGFVGAALGYRWLFVVAELNVLYSDAPAVTIADASHNVSGWVMAPSWGLRGVF
ncbi:MAG: hypothetical protein VX699_09365 [Myxococcota bacterium]|nr:hypothetical protein [Myxococcota bacterium]